MHGAARILLILMLQTPAPCKWGAATQAGTLAPSINEASGVALSNRFQDRMYHVNDSGDDGGFFITDRAGRNARRVDLIGKDLDDVEDLDLAPCDANTDCLFLADVGDNDRDRSNIEIVIVNEIADYPSRIRPRSRILARYPDGAHDAESLAVHPDGNIYILTKGLSVQGLRPVVNAAAVYRLRRDDWKNGRNAVLEHVTNIDLGKLLPSSLLGGRVATSMDISPDGKRVLILTYQDAVELLVDLSSRAIPSVWVAGRNYQSIRLVNLEQQEAIAYTPDGKSIIYTTERRNARIMTVRCAP